MTKMVITTICRFPFSQMPSSKNGDSAASITPACLEHKSRPPAPKTVSRIKLDNRAWNCCSSTVKELFRMLRTANITPIRSEN